jgi:hypothetical protein
VSPFSQEGHSKAGTRSFEPAWTAFTSPDSWPGLGVFDKFSWRRRKLRHHQVVTLRGQLVVQET